MNHEEFVAGQIAQAHNDLLVALHAHSRENSMRKANMAQREGDREPKPLSHGARIIVLRDLIADACPDDRQTRFFQAHENQDGQRPRDGSAWSDFWSAPAFGGELPRRTKAMMKTSAIYIITLDN